MNHLSQSGVATARDCKRKYYYRYVRRLQHRQYDPKPLHFGRKWHLMLEAWFTHRDSQRTLELAVGDEYLVAMFEGYLARWGRPGFLASLSEQQFKATIRNPATGRASRRFSQLGYMDMVAMQPDGRLWLWEHKTASTIDGQYLEKLWCDSQITGYVSALQGQGLDIAGVVYDIAKKTRVRQRKNEDRAAFVERLKELYLGLGMFHRETVIISDQQIYEWKADLWQVTKELLDCRRNDVWYRNTARCYDYHRPCEFVGLCMNGGSEALINAEYEPRTWRDETSNNPQPPQTSF